MDRSDYNRLDGITKKYVDFKVAGLTGGGGGSGTSGTSGSSGVSGSSGTSGAGGGSQSLAQTLAIGNDVGTYSIIAQSGQSLTLTGGNMAEPGVILETLNNPGNEFIKMGVNGMRFSYADIYFTTREAGIYSTISNSFLYTDSTGRLVGTGSQAESLDQTLLAGNTGSTSIRLIDGSTFSPSYAFRDDVDTGMYRPAAQQLAFVVNGVIAGRFSDNLGVKTFTGEDGTLTRPGIGFYADLDTGLWRPTTNQVGVSTGGATSAIFNTSGLRLPQLQNSFLAANSVGQIVATAAPRQTDTISLTLDGQGGVISTGNKGYMTLGYDGYFTKWNIIGTPTGSVVIDVWISSGQLPTSSNTIVGGQTPSLSGGQTSSSTSVSDWATFSTGQYLAFNVVSASTASFVRLDLQTIKI